MKCKMHHVHLNWDMQSCEGVNADIFVERTIGVDFAQSLKQFRHSLELSVFVCTELNSDALKFFVECCALFIYIDTNMCGFCVRACVFFCNKSAYPCPFQQKLSVCKIECIWLLSAQNNDNHGSWHIISTTIFVIWILKFKWKIKN